MKRTGKSDPALSGDRKLHVLESELTKVIEDFRLAKLAAKQAKAHAKTLKKEKKRVLRALIAAQAEQDERIPTGTREDVQEAPLSEARPKRKAATSRVTQRIADVPEVVRKPRRAKKPASAAASIDSPTAESVSESQLDSEIPGTAVSSAE